MPPSNNKRKRPERQYSNEEAHSRPSPHRPETLGLAQHGQQHGSSRGGRGGRGGGAGGRRQSRQDAAAEQRDTVMAVPATPVTRPPPQRITPALDTSRPATPLQRTPNHAQPAVEDRPPPQPFLYEYLTDEIVASWQTSGRDVLQETAGGTEEGMICTILDELVRSSLDGRLSALEAGSVIRQMISKHSEHDNLDVQSLFLNLISLLDDADTRNVSLLVLLTATDIDPEAIRQELDIPVLQNLSLVRSTFMQMRTRKTTNILYRQANFNLLREETEGYAKLITDYFDTARSAINDHSVSAEDAFQRVMALVGSFDLDVGRVLDITLDISANLLVRAYGFFVKFYRCSSWWPDHGVLDSVKWEDQGFNAFPRWALPGADLGLLSGEENSQAEIAELSALKTDRDVRFWSQVQEHGMDAFFDIGARKIVDFESVQLLLETEADPELDARGREINADRRKRINENRKYMRETRTLPPPGSSDAAQLLGFKLRFYASAARDASDVLPENLIYLAALLIKIGFISLRDLYGHLCPSDEGMPEEKKRLEKEKAEKEAKERPGGGANALALAGALPDDTLPVVRNLRGDRERSGGSTPKQEKKEEEPKEELPAPTNQKIMLLKALLLIGALPEALFILGRFPWLVDADASLPPYLHRIAKQMLHKVVGMARPAQGRGDFENPTDESSSLQQPATGLSASAPRAPPRKTTRWLGLDQVEKADGQSYKHYYADWDGNIPVCQTVEDVFLLCNTFLGYLGVKVGQDAELLGALVRIGKFSLTKDGSEFNHARWLELAKRTLVPALSLSKHNPGLSQDIYELLSFFPTTTRYNVYAEWYMGRTSRLPDMRVAFDHNRAEVKDVLRRVTNETGKKQARSLAKVALSSPGIVMMSMINQLESYSNMIPSLVECTKYFSFLAYDVLTWCLINSLGGQGRDRIQADGMLTSPWLQALSQFAASLFLRYSVINPSPVLQYLAFELRAGNTTDLEMFEQILSELAGIRTGMDYNDAQVLAMSGGEHLQAQTVLQLADKRHARKTTGKHLIRALAEPGLIAQFLIALAQEQRMYPYRESSKYMPLKVLGSNLDKIQQVFAQYLEVLRTFLDSAEFEHTLPDIVSLVSDFGLEPGIAFTICRMTIVHRMTVREASRKSEIGRKEHTKSQEEAESIVDVVMQSGQDRLPSNGVVEGEDQEDSTQNQDEKPASRLQAAPSRTEKSPWNPVLLDIIQRLPSAAPRLAEQISIPFFVTFWTLTLQDILVHTLSYDNEINKLRTQLKEIGADRSDLSTSGTRDKERKKKAITDTQARLTEELKSRIAAYQKTRNRLSRREKDHWFARTMNKEDSDARHVGLLQECFLPRAALSSLDAHYCYLMLKILHDNGTPGFCTMHLLHHLLRKQLLAAVMFQSTAVEAQHFGRFLCEVLKLLQHWHGDKAIYEKEGLGGKQKLPGFAKKLDSNGEPETVLEYEEFRRLLYNWHTFLYGSLQTCFESGEYMHIRNGIIVLRSIVQVFPTVNFMGLNLVKAVTKLSEEDPRQDLKLAAMSLRALLKVRERQWVLPQSFRLNDPSKDGARSGSQASISQAEAANGTTKLNASAPEFRPSSSGQVDGSFKKDTTGAREDGEIEDEKQAALKVEDTSMKDATSEDVKSSRQEQNSDKTLPVKIESTPALTPAEPRQELPKRVTPIPTKPASTNEQDRSNSASRPAHALPSRPDNRPLASSTDRAGGRYPKRADEGFGRLDPPSDLRSAARDSSPDERPRVRDQIDREPPSRERPRDERTHPRTSADHRYSRDDPYSAADRNSPAHAGFNSRHAHNGRDRFNAGMGPPQRDAAQPDRNHHISSVATPPVVQVTTRSSTDASQADRQHHENPARMALINDDPQQGRDRAGPAAASTNLGDSSGVSPAVARPSANRSSDAGYDADNRSSYPSELAPTGPRRGRLSREQASQPGPESSYGRLNGPQEMRPPNGPAGRGGRTSSSQHPSQGYRSNESPSQLVPTSRHADPPPTSRAQPPSTERLDTSASSHDRQANANSVPTTPSSEAGPSVHPSRMSHILTQSPVQTASPVNGPRAASSPISAPPSGPRGTTRPTPTGPAPAANGPPHGPAGPAERQRRGGDRMGAAIAVTLQNANNATPPTSQGVSFKGAAQNRQPAIEPSVAADVPVQAVASSLEPPGRRHEPLSNPDASKDDLFQRRQPGGAEASNRIEGRAPRYREDERPDRSRGSRNASRERKADDTQPPHAPFAADDSRDRRARPDRESWDGIPGRETRGRPRNSNYPVSRTQPGGLPVSFPGPQQADWERNSRRPGPDMRGPRGGARAEDFRGLPRREEERGGPGLRGPPPPRDAQFPAAGGAGVARKRRHEEAGFDETKRRRGPM